jgi:hypothetical protein
VSDANGSTPRQGLQTLGDEHAELGTDILKNLMFSWY